MRHRQADSCLQSTRLPRTPRCGRNAHRAPRFAFGPGGPASSSRVTLPRKPSNLIKCRFWLDSVFVKSCCILVAVLPNLYRFIVAAKAVTSSLPALKPMADPARALDFTPAAAQSTLAPGEKHAWLIAVCFARPTLQLLPYSSARISRVRSITSLVFTRPTHIRNFGIQGYTACVFAVWFHRPFTPLYPHRA